MRDITKLQNSILDSSDVVGGGEKRDDFGARLFEVSLLTSEVIASQSLEELEVLLPFVKEQLAQSQARDEGSLYSSQTLNLLRVLQSVNDEISNRSFESNQQLLAEIAEDPREEVVNEALQVLHSILSSSEDSRFDFSMSEAGVLDLSQASDRVLQELLPVLTKKASSLVDENFSTVNKQSNFYYDILNFRQRIEAELKRRETGGDAGEQTAGELTLNEVAEGSEAGAKVHPEQKKVVQAHLALEHKKVDIESLDDGVKNEVEAFCDRRAQEMSRAKVQAIKQQIRGERLKGKGFWGRLGSNIRAKISGADNRELESRLQSQMGVEARVVRNLGRLPEDKRATGSLSFLTNTYSRLRGFIGQSVELQDGRVLSTEKGWMMATADSYKDLALEEVSEKTIAEIENNLIEQRQLELSLDENTSVQASLESLRLARSYLQALNHSQARGNRAELTQSRALEASETEVIALAQKLGEETLSNLILKAEQQLKEERLQVLKDKLQEVAKEEVLESSLEVQADLWYRQELQRLNQEAWNEGQLMADLSLGSQENSLDTGKIQQVKAIKMASSLAIGAGTVALTVAGAPVVLTLGGGMTAVMAVRASLGVLGGMMAGSTMAESMIAGRAQKAILQEAKALDQQVTVEYEGRKTTFLDLVNRYEQEEDKNERLSMKRVLEQSAEQVASDRQAYESLYALKEQVRLTTSQEGAFLEGRQIGAFWEQVEAARRRQEIAEQLGEQQSQSEGQIIARQIEGVTDERRLQVFGELQARQQELLQKAYDNRVVMTAVGGLVMGLGTAGFKEAFAYLREETADMLSQEDGPEVVAVPTPRSDISGVVEEVEGKGTPEPGEVEVVDNSGDEPALEVKDDGGAVHDYAIESQENGKTLVEFRLDIKDEADIEHTNQDMTEKVDRLFDRMDTLDDGEGQELTGNDVKQLDQSKLNDVAGSDGIYERQMRNYLHSMMSQYERDQRISLDVDQKKIIKQNFVDLWAEFNDSHLDVLGDNATALSMRVEKSELIDRLFEGVEGASEEVEESSAEVGEVELDEAKKKFEEALEEMVGNEQYVEAAASRRARIDYAAEFLEYASSQGVAKEELETWLESSEGPQELWALAENIYANSDPNCPYQLKGGMSQDAALKLALKRFEEGKVQVEVGGAYANLNAIHKAWFDKDNMKHFIDALDGAGEAPEVPSSDPFNNDEQIRFSVIYDYAHNASPDDSPSQVDSLSESLAKVTEGADAVTSEADLVAKLDGNGLTDNDAKALARAMISDEGFFAVKEEVNQLVNSDPWNNASDLLQEGWGKYLEENPGGEGENFWEAVVSEDGYEFEDSDGEQYRLILDNGVLKKQFEDGDLWEDSTDPGAGVSEPDQEVLRILVGQFEEPEVDDKADLAVFDKAMEGVWKKSNISLGSEKINMGTVEGIQAVKGYFEEQVFEDSGGSIKVDADEARKALEELGIEKATLNNLSNDQVIVKTLELYTTMSWLENSWAGYNPGLVMDVYDYSQVSDVDLPADLAALWPDGTNPTFQDFVGRHGYEMARLAGWGFEDTTTVNSQGVNFNQALDTLQLTASFTELMKTVGVDAKVQGTLGMALWSELSQLSSEDEVESAVEAVLGQSSFSDLSLNQDEVNELVRLAEGIWKGQSDVNAFNDTKWKITEGGDAGTFTSSSSLVTNGLEKKMGDGNGEVSAPVKYLLDYLFVRESTEGGSYNSFTMSEDLNSDEQGLAYFLAENRWIWGGDDGGVDGSVEGAVKSLGNEEIEVEAEAEETVVEEEVEEEAEAVAQEEEEAEPVAEEEVEDVEAEEWTNGDIVAASGATIGFLGFSASFFKQSNPATRRFIRGASAAVTIGASGALLFPGFIMTGPVGAITYVGAMTFGTAVLGHPRWVISKLLSLYGNFMTRYSRNGFSSSP